MKAEKTWLGRALMALVTASILLAPAAMAQEAGGDWSAGEDNEFGSIRGPYQVTTEEGSASVEYRIKLNTLYEDRDTRYFMFMLGAEGTPMDVTIKSLETADGEAVEIFEKDGSNGVPKWTVDIKNMPAPGTTMVLKGSVTASEDGFWQMNSMVIPFTYRWEKVHMESGLEAKLQALTQVEATEAGAGFCGADGCGGPIKDVPVPAALAPVGVAVAALAWGRRQRP